MTSLIPEPVDVAFERVGAGSPVLLCTGTGYPGGTWPASLIDQLAARHTVISFDYRGTGRTPGTDDAYSTRLFAADAARLVERVGLGPAHVIGHSMGGRVAQWIALDHPDAVRSVTLVSSGAGPIDPASVPPGLPLDAMVALVDKGHQGYMRHQIESTFFTADFLERAPDRVTELVDAFWAGHPSTRDYLKHVLARQGHRTVDDVARITAPVLVLVGGADTHAGGTGSHLAQSEWLARNIPGARLVVVPGIKHGVFWEAPEASVQPIVAFLEEVDRMPSSTVPD